LPDLPDRVTLRDGDLVLRDWRDEEKAALAPLFGDRDIARFSSLPSEYSPAAALEHLTRLRAQRAAGELLALAVTRGAGSPLGNVNLVFRFGADVREAALGYWITPAARRRGLALDASRLLCEWGFRELSLTRVELLVEPANLASRRVAERLGAVREGVRPYEANGTTYELAMYSLRP
jgi:RimJ/RimL family protein N-acetyltransferase